MTAMRAKMTIGTIEKHSGGASETLHLRAVCPKAGYPADGSDEDNTFARWTPNASMTIQITNPDLVGKFAIGETYYIDFTKAA